MASFQSSLISGSTIGLVKACSSTTSTLTITDYSNYTTNTDNGHAAANFTAFRKIYLSLASGYEYILSSLDDGDQLISAASSLTNSFVYNIAGGDGVYTAELLTIPSWGNGVTYSINDVVYYVAGEAIYQSQTNSNLANNPASDDGTNWVELTEAEARLVYKYDNTQKVVLDCELSACIDNAVVNATCDICCAPYNQCDNVALMNSIELLAIQSAITTLSTTPSEFSKIQCLFDRADQLCCDNC